MLITKEIKRTERRTDLQYEINQCRQINIIYPKYVHLNIMDITNVKDFHLLCFIFGQPEVKLHFEGEHAQVCWQLTP